MPQLTEAVGDILLSQNEGSVVSVFACCQLPQLTEAVSQNRISGRRHPAFSKLPK
ncbi:MAG: hypothetical protein MUE81_07390 [Thermoflexibacter sp.]|nr:hypothetical protein [Thermoflexibacter sp.]